MQITKEQYFFYEWLIIEKGMTIEGFRNLTEQEFSLLHSEYEKWRDKYS